MKKQIVLLLMLILPILSYGMDYDLSYFSWRNAEDCDNDGYAGYREMYFIISPSNALSLTNGEKIIVEYRKNGVFTSWNEYKTYYHYFFTSGEYHSFEGSLEIDDLEKDGYDFRISVYSQNMSNEWVWQVTFDGGDNANLDNKNFEPKNEDGLCACATPTNVSASDGTSASYVYVSWTGAYNNEEYVVYRSTSSGSYGSAITGWLYNQYYYDYSAEPGVTYYYRIRARADNYYYSDYSAYNSGYLRATALDAPTGVTASDGDFTNKVRIGWNAPSGATHYMVYRSTSSGSYGSAITGWISSTYYYDYVSPGTTYYYRVKAAASSSGTLESGYSSYNSGYAEETSSDLDPPTGVSATDGTYTNKVRITWNTSSGATHYKVYRSTSSSSYGTAITGWISSTSYDDNTVTVGSYYYYRVKAASSSSGSQESDYSSYNQGYAQTSTVSAPTGVSASEGTYNNKVYISWNSMTNAHYQVYRSTESSAAIPVTPAWISNNYFYDENVVPGILYYYSVKALVGVEQSGFSPSELGYAVLDQPVISASDGTYPDHVHISWTAPAGAVYYKVYRSTDASIGEELTGDWITGNAYDDYSAVAGTQYEYRVKATADLSAYSRLSFSDVGYVGITYPSPPLGIEASKGTYLDSVNIVWNPSVEGGSYYYQVYRSTSVDILTATAITNWSLDTFYNDKNVVMGDVYYYWIAAATSSTGENFSGFGGGDYGYSRYLYFPDKVTNLSPADGVDEQPVNISLTWNGGDHTIGYRVYLGYGPYFTEAGDYQGTTSSESFALYNIDFSRRYYWRVDAINEDTITKGDVWYFTTTEDPSTGVEDQNISMLKMYPNPCTDMFILELEDLTESSTIQIYNVSGAMVYKEKIPAGTKLKEVSTQYFRAGIYNVNIIFKKKRVPIGTIVVNK